ncbi:MAG: sugar transferase [Phycisphaera sp.]|nr:MAG: sugar transferase [Phycisphaera sp.]
MIAEPPATPTVFGLSAVALHDRFWASRGVQVVRRAMPTPLVPHAHLFLLLQQRTLCLFELPPVVDHIVWDDADLVLLRMHDFDDHAYRERIISEDDGKFVRLERVYGSDDSRFARAAMTNRPTVARLWQGADSPRDGWRKLRKAVRREQRWPMVIDARVFDADDATELARCARLLVERWRKPSSTIDRAEPRTDRTWADPTAVIEPGAQCIGSVWIGAGRTVDANQLMVGPDIVWDDPQHVPDPGGVHWLDLEPTERTEPLRPRSVQPIERVIKRGFDIVFALVALLFTLPIYPFVMLAIWLEDGRPFFFAHTRESLNAKDFPCLKFRSMRKDAEKMKAELAAMNQVDGPQFYIANDPRLTRVGKFIRKVQIDELPQFLNVLVGHMSVVGPRPSPYKENQYCPGWREARLSVRPGVTGLWQVKRTRASDSDFQEWIRYDIEYVENMSLWLDLKIIWRTIAQIIRSIKRS